MVLKFKWRDQDFPVDQYWHTCWMARDTDAYMRCQSILTDWATQMCGGRLCVKSKRQNGRCRSANGKKCSKCGKQLCRLVVFHSRWLLLFPYGKSKTIFNTGILLVPTFSLLIYNVGAINSDFLLNWLVEYT